MRIKTNRLNINQSRRDVINQTVFAAINIASPENPEKVFSGLVFSYGVAFLRHRNHISSIICTQANGDARQVGWRLKDCHEAGIFKII